MERSEGAGFSGCLVRKTEKTGCQIFTVRNVCVVYTMYYFS